MRKIRKQKWFAKATALLISALLLVTMLPQAVMAADSDPTDQANMTDVTIAEETNVEEAVNDAVDKATVSESNAEETAAEEDTATNIDVESTECITGAESVSGTGSGESDESGVTSIKVEPIEIIEGTNGYTTSVLRSDGEKTFYYYNPIYTGNVTVTYNGVKYTGSFGAVANEIYNKNLPGIAEYPSFVFNTDQSYENQWKVGNTYDASVSFMGKTAPVKVKILPDPLESIYIGDLTMSEGAFQSNRYDSMGVPYLCYTSIPGDTEVTLVYSGKEYKEKYSALSSLMYSLTGQYYTPTFNSGETAGNQWQANHTYPASVSLSSKTCTFDVTVAESPFIGIEAEDIEVIENTGGHYNDMLGVYYYNYSSNITLTTDTGEKITKKITMTGSNEREGGFPVAGGSLPNDVSYNGETFYVQVVDDQNTSPWGVGKHTATVSIGSLQKDFTVNVVETPVEKIVFNPPVISVYEAMSGIPDSSLDYTIHFKDGSTMDVTGRTVMYNGQNYEMTVKLLAIKAGERKTVPVSLMGKDTTVDVECLAIDSIELAESDGLKLLIKRADGSIDEQKVYYMYYLQATPYWLLITDKGTFHITYDYTGDYENMSITLITIGAETNPKSNQLKNSKWLKTAVHTSDYDSLRFVQDPTILASAEFDGKVTKDNIDVIATVAYLSESLPSTFVEGDSIVDADLLKSAINEVFVVSEDFDMSLSPNYDPAANTIRLRGVSGKGEKYYPEVISTNKEQGFWLHSHSEDIDIKFVFDDDYKIARINSDDPEPEFIKGDVNGDKAVDAKDLTTLAKHVAKIALITDAGLLKAADVNGDGTVDAKDLTHLAKYVAKIIPEL